MLSPGQQRGGQNQKREGGQSAMYDQRPIWLQQEKEPVLIGACDQGYRHQRRQRQGESTLMARKASEREWQSDQARMIQHEITTPKGRRKLIGIADSISDRTRVTDGCAVYTGKHNCVRPSPMPWRYRN
jgi:hypothetical protein